MAQIIGKVTLVTETGEKKQFNHATPSAKRRIDFTRITSESVKTDEKSIQGKLSRLVLEGELEGKDRADIFKGAIEDGTFSIDDLMNFGEMGVEATEHNCLMTFALFRACVDVSNVGDGWKEKIESDDFMMDQNFVEVQRFVDSFRQLYTGTEQDN